MVISIQSLSMLGTIVCEVSPTLSLRIHPDGRTTRRPNTDHYIDSHLFNVSQKVSNVPYRGTASSSPLWWLQYLALKKMFWVFRQRPQGLWTEGDNKRERERERSWMLIHWHRACRTEGGSQREREKGLGCSDIWVKKWKTYHSGTYLWTSWSLSVPFAWCSFHHAVCALGEGACPHLSGTSRNRPWGIVSSARDTNSNAQMTHI